MFVSVFVGVALGAREASDFMIYQLFQRLMLLNFVLGRFISVQLIVPSFLNDTMRYVLISLTASYIPNKNIEHQTEKKTPTKCHCANS